MASCLLDKLLAMCDNKGLVCTAISSGYAFNQLREDNLEKDSVSEWLDDGNQDTCTDSLS